MGSGGSSISIQNPFNQSRSETRKQQRKNASGGSGGIGAGIKAEDISVGGGGKVLDWDIRDTFSRKGNARQQSQRGEWAKARAKREAVTLSNQRRLEEKQFREEKSRKKRLAAKGGIEKTKLRSTNKLKSAIGSMKTNMPRIG